MLCLRDYEEYAEKHLDHRTWAFFSQGAERDWTLKENLRSYTRYNFIPRMLLNHPVRDLTTTVLGHKVSIPIGLAPTAYQKLAHPDGEIASSRAAEDMGTVFTLSTVSNTSLEDIANSVKNRSSPLFMQLYMARIGRANEDLIKKSEANGYKAIVLTVDTPIVGLQLKMWKAGGIQMPPHLSVPNVDDSAIKMLSKDGVIPNHIDLTRDLFNCNISWDDVKWIKSITNLPLILKGIITAEDATKAAHYGVAAVWVSNHGGRQLDGVSSTIDVLPEIVAALEGTNCEVYADGGVRWGSDVLKLLARGARFVFIGRPLIWGLTYSGQDGVRNVLQILKSELDRAMHLAGCRSINEVGPHLVKRIHCCKM